MSSLRPYLFPALRLAAIYAVVGGLWILFSDAALEALVPDPALQAHFQTWKGWFYVFITAVLLFWLVLRQIKSSAETARALNATHDAFHAVFHALPMAVHGYNQKGKTILWNHGCELHYGFTEKEALGKSLSELILRKDNQLDIAETIRSLNNQETPMRCAPLTMLRKDGTLVTVHSTQLNLNLPDGRNELFFLDFPIPEDACPKP